MNQVEASDKRLALTCSGIEVNCNELPMGIFLNIVGVERDLIFQTVLLFLTAGTDHAVSRYSKRLCSNGFWLFNPCEIRMKSVCKFRLCSRIFSHRIRIRSIFAESPKPLENKKKNRNPLQAKDCGFGGAKEVLYEQAPGEPQGFVWRFFGGGGGSRTPVRKRFLGNLSGRRRSFTFPRPVAGRQAKGLGSFMIHGALKALRTHGRHFVTPDPGPWPCPVRRPR